MAQETLLTAARRLSRFMNVDSSAGGGLLSVDTQHALSTLQREIERAGPAATSADNWGLVHLRRLESGEWELVAPKGDETAQAFVEQFTEIDWA